MSSIWPETTDGLGEAVAELTRFARYERRAWSSQKKAMRNFMNIKFRQAREHLKVAISQVTIARGGVAKRTQPRLLDF
jgi:hypothetical protein